MKRALKITASIALLGIVLVGVWVTDNLIYPFKAENPNYSDVEAAFSKIQFPSDWKEISSSENRGLHGRGCNPLNDSGCFHKNKTFLVNDISNSQVSQIFSQLGCQSPSIEENNPTGGTKYDVYKCGIGSGLELTADVIFKETLNEVTLGVKTL